MVWPQAARINMAMQTGTVRDFMVTLLRHMNAGCESSEREPYNDTDEQSTYRTGVREHLHAHQELRSLSASAFSLPSGNHGKDAARPGQPVSFRNQDWARNHARSRSSSPLCIESGGPGAYNDGPYG